MGQALKYIVDEHGKKTSVLVPVKVWEDLNERSKRLQKKLEVMKGIKHALKEVEEANRTGQKLPTLSEFLK